MGKKKGRPSTMNKENQLDKKYENMSLEEKVAIICELQQKYPLKILIKISGLKRSTYYYTLSRLTRI